MLTQLPLSIGLRVDATLENFYISHANAMTVNAIKQFCQHPNEHFFYLWGNGGSGISHLLQAIQHQAAHSNIHYLPLAELFETAGSYSRNYSLEDMFSHLESLDLIVIDDLEKITDIENGEIALFHLYNRLRDQGKQLIVGAHASPRELPLQLPDLQSRLNWGISYQLYALNDNEKKQALIDRANAMGIRLSDEVTHFMLTHCSRDLRQLMQALSILDNASLSEKRPLTIPFVKQVLGL
jgi:DnaA-homolog protein